MNPGYQNFLETLSQHCHDLASGVLHLYTTENHYGRIGIVGGEITHLSLHSARGITALPMLLLASISSHRFEVGAKLPAMEDLLDTPDILAMLGAGELETLAAAQLLTADPQRVLAIPVVAAEQAAPETAVRGISANALRIIEQALHRELGPMAGSLVQEGLPHANTAYQLAEYLADQLMPTEGEKFLHQVTALLRAPGNT